MSIINEVLDENDPRKERQLANTSTPPPVTAQPQPQLASPPSPVAPPPEPPAPSKPLTDSAPPDLYNQPISDLDTTRQVDESLPVISPGSVVGNDQENEDYTSVFPSVNNINTDVAEQVAGNVDPGLQSFLGTAQDERLKGARYPFLTEIESERSRLNRGLTQANNRLRSFIADDARRQAARTLIQPLDPRKSEAFNNADANPGLDLDFTGGLENWNLGFFKGIKDRADAIVGSNPVENFLNDKVVSRFRPLGSSDDINEWVAGIKKNPWQLLNPIGVIGGQIHREGEFGDFGKGLLGAAFYGLSLYDNVITGGLVDLGNMITGNKNVESDLPNFIQGALGQDYSFTEANSEITRTVFNSETGKEEQITLARGANPLAVVGSREAPKTLGDLKERSWLWEGVIGGLGVLGLVDEDTPTGNVSGRLFQVPEFTTGLLLDVLVPSPKDFINLGKKAANALGIGNVSPGRVVPEVRQLPPAPDRPRLPGAPERPLLPGSREQRFLSPAIDVEAVEVLDPEVILIREFLEPKAPTPGKGRAPDPLSESSDGLLTRPVRPETPIRPTDTDELLTRPVPPDTPIRPTDADELLTRPVRPETPLRPTDTDELLTRPVPRDGPLRTPETDELLTRPVPRDTPLRTPDGDELLTRPVPSDTPLRRTAEPGEELLTRPVPSDTPLRRITEPGEELLTRPVPPDTPLRRVIDPDAIDVPTPSRSGIDDVVSKKEVPDIPEEDVLRAAETGFRTPELGDLLRDRALKQGEIEESLVAATTDLNKPLNPEIISTPSPIVKAPPPDTLGSGSTEFFRKVAKGEYNDIDLTPEAITSVRRSNAQLTQLAMDAGLVPLRNTPLSAKRIEMLDERYPGMFERYGQALERTSRRDLVTKAPATPTRLATSEVIASKHNAIPEVNLNKLDNIDDLNAARLADTFVDRVADVPARNLQEIAMLARKVLPADFADFDNLEELGSLLRNERAYKSLVREAGDLGLALREQVMQLKDLNAAIDELPDVGRRTIISDAGYKNLPPALPPKRTPPKVNQELVDEIKSISYAHGTRVTIGDFSRLDPVQGAARSETGVGIHFTTNNELAVAHAIKPINRNLPLAGQQITPAGRMLEVTVQPRNLIDGKAGLPDDVKEIIRDAVAQIKDAPPNVRQNLRRRLNSGGKSYTQFINDIDDVLLKGFPDEAFPEELALNIQRSISSNLRVNGIDGVVVKGADQTQLTIFNHKIIDRPKGMVEVGNRVPSDPATQALFKRNASKATHELLPDSTFAKVDFEENQATMLTRMLTETSKQIEELKRLTEATAEYVAEQESVFRKNVRATKKARRAAQERRWKAQNDDLIKHNNKPFDTFC